MNFLFRSLRKKGSAMFLLITVVGILYIFGMLLINYMTQEKGITYKLGENLQAYYLAEAVIEKAQIKLRKLFDEELLDEDGKINDQMLNLLDIDRIENFVLRVTIEDGELIENGSAEVLVRIKNVDSTPLKSYIDEYETVPAMLKIYKKENKYTYADKALGGYEGILSFQAEGKFKNAQKKLVILDNSKVCLRVFKS